MTAAIAEELAQLAGDGYDETDSSKEACLFLRYLLTETRESIRYMSSNAQAYRADFDSTTPRHSPKLLFWRFLNSYLTKDLELPDFSFLSDLKDASVRLPDPTEAQYDLMNVTHVAPQPIQNVGMLRRTWSDAICEKLGVIFWPVVGSFGSSKRLQRVHVHIDVPPLMPLQKLAEHSRRDLARVGEESSAQSLDLPRLSDEYKLTQADWAIVVLSDRRTKDVMASAHLTLAGKVLHALNEEWNLKAKGRADSRNEIYEWRNLEVYLHGGNIAVKPGVIGLEVSSTEISFLGDVVIVSPSVSTASTDQEESLPIDTIVALQDAHGSVSPYGRGCCIAVNQAEGYSRFASGDQWHAEAETGMVRSHIRFSRQSTVPDNSLQGPMCTDPASDVAACESSLFVMRDSDCPNIMLLCSEASANNSHYVIGDVLISIPRARLALQKLELTPRAITLLFALGGCDFTAGTRGIPQIIP